MTMAEDFDKKRVELLEANSKAWGGDVTTPSSNLDSSLKKNTSVVRKVRILTRDAEASILKDINTTSLEKYLPELIGAIVEGLSKLRKDEDFQSAVKIVSALHQRFTVQFTPALLSEVLFELANPAKSDTKVEKDEVARVAKQRAFLRVLTELLFVGVFQNDVLEICDKDMLPDYVIRRIAKSGREPLLLSVLKEILSFDHKSGSYIGLVTNYLKKYATYFLDDDLTFMTADTKDSVVGLFEAYTDIVFKRTVEVHQLLKRQISKNKAISMKTGKIVEGIEVEIEDLDKLFEKFQVFSKFLGEKFDKEVPVFDNSAVDEEESIITGVTVGKAKDHDSIIWETEEVKKFYTDIPDISSTISADVLNSKNTPSVEPVTDSGRAAGEKMTKFLDLMDNCSTAKDVDNAVYQFWYANLNNKASKNRLMKHMMEVEEFGKLKYLARFIAINKNYLADVKDELITSLDKGFRSQIHTNRLNMKNIIFFCELIKFKLVPIHVLFHKIRSLILNITVQNNIEILGLFFENCGKFLLNDSEYKEPMAEMVELLKHKRQHDNLNTGERYAIDSIMLILKPITVKQLRKAVVKLAPEEAFLIVLIQSELNEKTVPDVLKILRKFDFQDDTLFERLKSLLTSPDEINFNHIPALARLTKFFTSSSRKLRIFIIDAIIEKIQRDLELNDYRKNRIRLADARYLADLSNEELININVMINIMYRILCFGHPGNNPMANQNPPLDPTDNYFRIALICQILSTLNVSKLRKKQQEKLELFLVYFDYYWNVKKQPVPVDTNFKMVLMLEKVKPDFVRAKNWKESVERLHTMMTAMKEHTEDDNEEDEEEEEDEEKELELEEEEEEDAEEEDEEGEEDDDEFDSKFPDAEFHNEVEDNDDENDNDNDEEEDDDDEEDEEVVKAKQREAAERRFKEAQEAKWEEDLEKQLKLMVKESIEQRKYDKIGKFNAPLPPKQQIISKENGDKSVSFRLLSKGSSVNNNNNNNNNSKKPMIATRTIALPNTVKFANRIIEEEQRQKYEKDRIKNFVLNMKSDE